MSSNYTAKDIEVLEGLEPVRRRPGMFIAGTDTPAGLLQMATEILDNSVDEAMNGYADKIQLTLHKDGSSITVTDNGRGIPTETHPTFKKSALELILTTLHAGGKFSDKNYKTAGGLHGVGSSVVNALSIELTATVKRGGKEYQQKFSKGKALGGLKVVNKTARGTGTTIFFRPDPDVFKYVEFSAKTLRYSIESRAYLNPGLRIVFINEVEDTKEEFYHPDGIKAYLQNLLKDRSASAVGDELFFLDRANGVDVALAFAWTSSPKEELLSYANGIFTPEGGTHEVGAKNGIVKAVKNYISVHNISLKGVKLGAEDIREGLVGILSVKLPGGTYQAQFQGQTKSKLNNPEITPIVESVARGLEQLLNQKPNAAQAIVNRIILASKARAASREAGQEVRRKLSGGGRLTLPGKLADCSSNRAADTEVFIVEGDSAGGSAKQGRDRNTQAVLPLRGKVLNTFSATLKKVMENKEISNIVQALGCGVGESCKAEKLRYGKVIILTDADADGMHIATLLLSFFFQYMRPIIEKGALYIGRPPLYGIFSSAKAAQEKEISGGKSKKKGGGEAKSGVYWAYSDQELNKTLEKYKLKSPRIVRYKGLGEMNPKTLWDTTLDPDSRTLLRITVEEEAVVNQMLNDLMGSDPAPRYRLIRDNAELLDVDV